jgi:hypothetical protein
MAGITRRLILAVPRIAQRIFVNVAGTLTSAFDGISAYAAIIEANRHVKTPGP